MGKKRPAALLPIIGFMLFWPHVLTKSASSKPQTAADFSPSAVQEEERPRVEKLMTQNCDGTMENFCFNNGQCMFLVDLNEHSCMCESGFSGHRCSHMVLVYKPLGEEQIIATVFCVVLLIIGLAGALYFCCKWYKKKRIRRQQTQQGYRGVQTA
ncbi:proepiregulin-like isoform X1 [Genypterus blacodes]|uniref:proepiregulin-like isoform X1 n=2 Tax=Genypterus blacodes TaxID=154954 RepID=UPI003F75A184